MVVKAVIKLQRCRTNTRQAFVGRGREEHGIAKGRVERFEVTGESWAHIRSVLKTFEVMGHSLVRRDTVESFTEDIGKHPYGKLSLVHPADLLKEAE
jgi:hypothetical protein